MRKMLLTTSCLIVFFQLLATVNAQSVLEMVELDGGPVVTSLAYGIAVNEGSSLTRKWFVINDNSCPVQLNDVGIKISYYDRRSSYSYYPLGNLECKTDIAACEIRFMLFSIWGEHMSTLSGTKIVDLKSGAKLSLNGELGSWNAWENDVTVLFTVVAFVARVRRLDGGGWSYDSEPVLRKIESVKLQLSEESLSPSTKKE